MENNKNNKGQVDSLDTINETPSSQEIIYPNTENRKIDEEYNNYESTNKDFYTQDRNTNINKKTKKRILFGIVLLVTFTILGAIIWSTNSDIELSEDNAMDSSKVLFGYDIDSTKCNDVKPKMPSDQRYFPGDICYSKNISLDGEEIEIIVVSQSDEFYSKELSDSSNNCQIDCGGSIALPKFDRQYIVRQNGTTEYLFTGWFAKAQESISDLTGCSFYSFYNNESNVKLVKDNYRVGLSFSADNFKQNKDDIEFAYGSECEIDVDLVAYTTNIEPKLKINKLNVRYDLVDMSVCEEQDNASKDSCYTYQAGFRGDISICNNTLHPTLGTMSSNCVSAVANRLQNESICQNDYSFSNRSYETCVNKVKENKSYLFTDVQYTKISN